jgi:peptidoglycan/LPS O-acetylase OafA/YrhL
VGLSVTSSAPSERDSSELRPLTALRGILAIWILLYNAVTIPDSPASLGSSVAGFGLILAAPFAVDLFFMLSGFVLAYRYRDAFPGPRRFLVRRLAHIYPLHALTVLALAVMVLAAPRLGVQMTGASARLLVPSDLPYQFLLVHGFVFDRPSWNFPSWPLSGLAVCYVLFALTPPQLGRAVVRLVLVALIVSLLADMAIVAGLNEPVAGLPGIARAVAGFVSGCLLYRLKPSGSLPKGSAEFAALALVALAAFDAGSAWLLPVGLLLIAALSKEEGALCRWLSAGVPHWLGTISYAVILCQIPVYLVLRKAVTQFGPDLIAHQPVIFVVLYLAVSLVVSQLAYRWVERPARDGIARRLG